jgi:hypothetical protein
MKAKMALASSVSVIVIGLVPVLYFAALAVAQLAISIRGGSWVPLPMTLLFADHSLLQNDKAAALLAFIPQFPMSLPAAVAWALERLHVGLVFAPVGVVIAASGALAARRQLGRIRQEKQDREDRLRRAQDYRRGGSPADALEERLEPFIGSGSISGKQDRRAA